jgi:excisionase family DNA binding protein
VEISVKSPASSPDFDRRNELGYKSGIITEERSGNAISHRGESAERVRRENMSRYGSDAIVGVVAFEPLLSLREAADLLGVHWKTLEIFARRGQIPGTKVGKRWRFRASVLDRWLADRLGPTNEGVVAEGDKLDPQPRRAS